MHDELMKYRESFDDNVNNVPIINEDDFTRQQVVELQDLINFGDITKVVGIMGTNNPTFYAESIRATINISEQPYNEERAAFYEVRNVYYNDLIKNNSQYFNYDVKFGDMLIVYPNPDKDTIYHSSKSNPNEKVIKCVGVSASELWYNPETRSADQIKEDSMSLINHVQENNYQHEEKQNKVQSVSDIKVKLKDGYATPKIPDDMNSDSVIFDEENGVAKIYVDNKNSSEIQQLIEEVERKTDFNFTLQLIYGGNAKELHELTQFLHEQPKNRVLSNQKGLIGYELNNFVFNNFNFFKDKHVDVIEELEIKDIYQVLDTDGFVVKTDTEPEIVTLKNPDPTELKDKISLYSINLDDNDNFILRCSKDSLVNNE